MYFHRTPRWRPFSQQLLPGSQFHKPKSRIPDPGIVLPPFAFYVAS